MGESESFSDDVFLSFRGEDTRLGFTGHLYNALIQRGIRAFMDEGLRKGEELRPALFKAIEQSRIAIIVFSKNFAFSTFCLDELAMILDCFKEKRNRRALPVFYLVDPSDVRKQRGSYAEAMTSQEERFKDDMKKVNGWRNALHQAANLKGFHFRERDGYEYEFIGRIIKEVSSTINRMLLHVANYPVGLESRVQRVKCLLSFGSNDVVHMIGIVGLGGIGKTTIARAVYNSISDQFEDLCFLEDVRDNSRKHGLVHVQRMLLSKIIGDVDIDSVKGGISKIKCRFQQKKILLVVDDVDSKEQLDAIVGAPDWFCCGSKVIITTRDKGLLTNHKVDITYEVDELNDQEAHELLRWHAFKTDKVDPSYADIISCAVTYASKLPLALEVIGSNLCGRGVEEWECALDRYKRITDKRIQDILRVSFDSLEGEEKEVFLDIACCFGGYRLSEVENILHAHRGSSMRHSIVLLIEKCLIKIDDDHVTLHHLIQEMGKEIVRQESQEPSERSRLWSYEEVVQVLQENKGTSKTKILILAKDDMHMKGSQGEEMHCNGEAINKMDNLKTLIIRNGRFSVGHTHLPNSLRVLKWSGYPTLCLPQSFQPKKLSILELHDSSLRACDPVQAFISLKVLDFCRCDVTEIPDISGILNLEKLSFKHCQSLTKIHDSIGNLRNLKILVVAHCIKLRTIPPFRLTSLEQFNLSHCSNLESFPEILVKMENITELHVMRTPIKELPPSIQNLTQLRQLKLQCCGMVGLPSSIIMLTELGLMHVSDCKGLRLSNQDKDEEMKSKSSNAECLTLSSCNISNEFFPVGLTWFANVKDLNLSGNNFTVLHTCIKECHLLRNLKLDDCKFLRAIRGIPEKLETLSAKGCTSLNDLDLMVPAAFPGQGHPLRHLVLDDCVYLQTISGYPPNLDNFFAKNCTCLPSWCSSMLLNQESVEAGNKKFFLPGTRIPDWFDYQTGGGSLSFWFRNKFPVVSLCLVIGLVDDQPITVKFSPIVFVNGEKQSLSNQKVYKFRIETEHVFLFDLHLLKFEDNLEVICSDNEWKQVDVLYADHMDNDAVPIKQVIKQIGIHVDKQTRIMDDIRFTKPSPKKRKSDNFHLTWKYHHLCHEEKHTEDTGVSESRLTQSHQYVPLLTWEHHKEQVSLVSMQVIGNSSHQRIEPLVKRPRNDQNMEPSLSILTSTRPPIAEAENGLPFQSTPSVESPWENIRGETSKRLAEDEVHPTTIQNEICHRGDDVKAVSSSEVESEESSSNSEDSDSENPFNMVTIKLSIKSTQTISSGVSSGDASLKSIREAIDTLELLMGKDLSEVSSDPALQSQLDHLLDLLNTSSHRQVTMKVKKAIAEFRRKAFASFQEFKATVEPLNKLKNFEEQKARIQKNSSVGTARRNDLTDSINKASLDIKANKRRRKKLESEIANLKKELAAKQMELQQVVSDVKNQEAARSTYLDSRKSLDKLAEALSNEADVLLADNREVEVEGEAAEVKQNTLKSTWSTDLPSLFHEIKNSILGPSLM